MSIAPVRFGMPISERARTELRYQRAAESKRLEEQLDPVKAEFGERFGEAETLERIHRSPWPRNDRWSDDEYRFREYVKIETELLEKKDAITSGDNYTQREVSQTLTVINDLLRMANTRQRELMQSFSIGALDRMTGWLSGNARFRTQTDEDLARHFRRQYNARV